MRRLRGAIRAVSLILVLALLSLIVFLAGSVYTSSSRYLTSGYNTRLNAARKSVRMGEITDRNGVLLASTSQSGQRVYHGDETVRRAVSQTVGDQMSMSGTGVETFHADTLLGLSGSIVDRTWQYLSGKGYAGEDIRLTIDASLCAYIARRFPADKRGAVCVINYSTGEILAMVSRPDYDPQPLASGEAAEDESGSGYLNRCLQGQYAPGSAFKIVTLAAALDALPDAEALTFQCEGVRPVGEGTVSCYGRTAHGALTLANAFAKSCNIAFAQTALTIGQDALLRTAQSFGFNDNFRFRDVILYESSLETRRMNDYDLAWTGIGQGVTLVTPMHMAMIAGAVANGGVMREPALIAQVTGESGIPRVRTAAGVYRQALSRQTADLVRRYMRYAVEKGTGSGAAVSGWPVCGKTGSAEISNDKSVKTNAWFVGFVDDDRAPYAIAVVVEQAGTGGDVAAPLAGDVFRRLIGETAR